MVRGAFSIIAGICLIVGHVSGAPPDDVTAERQLEVGYYHLGPNDLGAAMRRPSFVQRLSARPGLAAAEVRLRPQSSWRAVPEDPSGWLALISVVFAQRQNWLALQFAGEEGTVSLAAWRPAIAMQNTQKYQYLNSIPPGPDQISDLAMIELAAAVGQVIEHPRAANGPIVGIVVEPWTDVPEAAALGDLLGEGGDQSVPASRPADGEALEGIRALALAAAWELGLRPKLGEAPSQLILRVSRGVQGYGLQVTWRHDGGESTVSRQQIPETIFYPGLRAMLKWAMHWGDGVQDFVQPEAEGFLPLLCDGKRLAYQLLSHTDKHTLKAISVGNLLTAWVIPQPERAPPDFAAGTLPDGTRTLVSIQPALQTVDPQSGKEFPARMGKTEMRWGFALLSAEEALTIHERLLRRITAGKELWSFRAPLAIRCGPAPAGELVLIGSDDGSLFGISLASGGEQWRRQLKGTPHGPLITAGELVLVTSRPGKLSAIRIADGTIVWERELGDTVTAPPVVAGNHVSVGWGNGHLASFSLSDGAQVAEARHPFLLRTLTPVSRQGETLLAGVEMGGTVAFYSLPELQLMRTVPLDIRPVGAPLFVAEAPVRWGSGDPLIDLAPQLLVPDHDGILYILPIPKAGGD